MSIYTQIQSDMTAALKARETERREALSFLFSELKAVAVEAGKRLEGLSDAESITVLQKQKKSREETLQSAVDGGREELAAKSRYEIALIAEYLPEAPSEAKIEEAVRAVIADLGATSMRDMGKVMAEVPNRLAGVDRAALSGVVKRLLSA